MKSQIIKWLKEPHLQAYFSSYDVSAVLVFFRFDLVGLDSFYSALGACVALTTVGAFIYKQVNRFRLEEIHIRTKELELLEKESEVLAKISERGSL